MFLTFLFELNKSKKKKEIKEIEQESLKKSKKKKSKKKNIYTKDKNKNNKKDKLKKKKNQKKTNILIKEPLNKKGNNSIFSNYFKGFFLNPYFFLFCLIFCIVFSRSVFLLGSETIYIEGSFKQYNGNKYIFVPDCTKLKKNKSLEHLNKEDIFYYKYNKEFNQWIVNTKGGLKLEVIDENDYYIFSKVHNLDNIIFDENFLSANKVPVEVKVSVPLKHLFDQYKIYFSLNDAVNILRDEYGIYKKDKK